MSSYGTYQVKDKKCATCNFYQGPRRFGMRVHKPFYVYADMGSYPCMAYKNRNRSANNYCPAWQKWVNIP